MSLEDDDLDMMIMMFVLVMLEDDMVDDDYAVCVGDVRR